MSNFKIKSQPKKVIFCKQCLYSNQKVVPSTILNDNYEHSNRFFLRFNKDGICSACELIEKKRSRSIEKIDWEKREKELNIFLEKYRSKNGYYDCIVPGSGGKDSVFQAHILKTKYGMNPLTVTFAPIKYTNIGASNFHKWPENGNVNNILFSPKGSTYGKLVRIAFEKMLHPFQPFIFGQRHFASHMAKLFNIKLIFLGEPHSEFGSEVDEENNPEMLERFFTKNEKQKIFLSGVEINKLMKNYNIQKNDLDFFLPMDIKEVKKLGIKQMFLGYYEKILPQENFYNAVKITDFKVNEERTEGTYSKYNSLDDKIDGFHYWTSFIKFGIGRTTEEASNEIRHGYITRKEGIKLVNKYDGEFPKKYFKDFLKLTNLKEEEFFNIVDQFRPEHLWEKSGNDFRFGKNWVLKNKIK